jgi:hypothetical protein
MPKKHKQKQKQSRGAVSLRPPPFQANFRVKHLFRFKSINSANAIGITRRNLLNIIFMNISTTSNGRLFSSVKLNRVEVWAVGGTSANSYSATSIALNWLSSLGPNSEISDTGNAVNTAHFAASPPRTSLASFWSLSGSVETEVLFNLTCPADTIVDVWVDGILLDGQGAGLTTTSSGTATAIFFGYLDGPGGGAVFQPVSTTSLA